MRTRQCETIYLGIWIRPASAVFPPAGGVWGGMRAGFRMVSKIFKSPNIRNSIYGIITPYRIETQQLIYCGYCNMAKISKKLGENIKRIRLSLKMTQGDICRKLKMDRSYMSAIESGKKNITLGVLEKLADALDVSVDELLK